MRLQPFPRDPSVPPAPISTRQRAALLRRLNDLPGVASRQGTTLSAWDQQREENAGRLHFEVGAWGWWSQQRADLLVEERARVVFAILASGMTGIGYEFFTAFSFGERQFDAFFEMGDGADVVQAVSDLVLASDHPVALKGLQANGWQREPRQRNLI